MRGGGYNATCGVSGKYVRVRLGHDGEYLQENDEFKHQLGLAEVAIYTGVGPAYVAGEWGPCS